MIFVDRRHTSAAVRLLAHAAHHLRLHLVLLPLLRRHPDLLLRRGTAQWAPLALAFGQRTLTIWGSINVQLTSFLTSLDSATLLTFNQQQIYLFTQIQTSQTGGRTASVL